MRTPRSVSPTLSRRAAALGAGGLGLALARRARAAQDATPAAGGAHPLVGAWGARDVRNETGGPSLIAFTGDGIALESTLQGFGPMGAWRPTGPRSAEATLVNALVDPDTGAYQGTWVHRYRIEVDAAGAGWTADYTATVVDALGEVLETATEPAFGVRVPVEAPEAGGASLAGFAALGTPTP